MLNGRARRYGTRPGVCVLLAGCAACSPKPLPDPRAAAQRWAEAVQKGDAAAAYDLLSDDARRAFGRKGVVELLEQHRKELAQRGQAAAAPHARLEASATVTFADDRSARVMLERGRYRVAAAGAFPAAAATPLDALRELREVLSRRSFGGLLRVLTRDSAQTLEGSLEDLLKALDEPSSVDIELEGRRAVAKLPGGHRIELEREDGVWKVKEFD
jgi:hypothetical protein